MTRFVFLAALAATGLPAQDPSTVEGRVLHALTGEPIRKAQVSLRRSDGRNEMPREAVTDPEGRFVFTGVNAGRYLVVTQRTGFVISGFGSRGAGRPGTTLALDEGQSIKDIVIRLSPQGVITGRIVDEEGEPMMNVSIMVSRMQYARGRRQLVPAGSGQTNDLGDYRVHSLPPGKYFVSANSRIFVMGGGNRLTAPKGDEGYPATFYPNTTDPGAAAPLEIAPGTVLQGINITMRKARMVRITGRVLNAAADRPGRNTVIYLVPRDPSAAGNRPSTVSNDQDGRFELHGVSRGSYTLVADLYENGKRSSARLPVEVGDSDIDGVSLAIAPGQDIPGRVRVEGDEPYPITMLHVTLQPRNDSISTMGAAGGPVKEDGSFSISNVLPDPYLLTVVGLRDNFYLKSVKWGNQEAPDLGVEVAPGSNGPVEVVISGKGAQVTGTVVNPQQQPAVGCTVALVPDAAGRNRPELFRSTLTDQSGRFTLRGIRPGEYKLFAWEDVEPGAYLDPDFLKQYEKQGEAVSLGEGAQQSVQLKIM